MTLRLNANSGKRRIALSCFFIVMLIFVVYYGPQVIAYLEFRRMTMPQGLQAQLQPLREKTISSAPGTTVAAFGYTFDVPWTGLDRQQNEGRWLKLHFSGGQQVLFINPSFSQDQVIVGREPSVFHLAFGTNLGMSKYSQFLAMASITPSQLTPFLSHSDFAKRRVYLENKGTYLEHSGAVELFQIDTGFYKGFEVSRILRDHVAIILFDEHDQKIELDVSARPGSLDQAEINRVTSSFTKSQSTPNTSTVGLMRSGSAQYLTQVADFGRH